MYSPYGNPVIADAETFEKTEPIDSRDILKSRGRNVKWAAGGYKPFWTEQEMTVDVSKVYRYVNHKTIDDSVSKPF